MRVIGIDPDTRNITLCVLEGPKLVQHAIIAAKGQRAEDRLKQLWDGFGEWAHQQEYVGPVDYAYVEKPMYTVSAAATIAQSIVIGVIRAVLWQAEIPHSLVDPGTWKKEMLGTGHASKEEIKALALTLFHDLDTSLAQDVYDSAIIGRWGANKFTAASVQDGKETV